ncbi:MAG: hypothetical protein IKA47_09515 [Oscillospiraceae bacterium]|nr:hypothetical protein [Oscillospiraceae bacterium]
MRKVNIPMTLACVLLCLTLITTHMTGGLFARYTVTATGSDEARVAKFDVKSKIDKTEVAIECEPDGEGEFQLTVTNQSEVAVRYTVSLNFYEELPSGVTVKLDGQEGTISDSGTTFSFTGEKVLAPGESSDAQKLTFSVSDFTKDLTGGSVQIERTFDLDIYAEQID